MQKSLTKFSVSAVLCTVFISGCSSPPRQVTASVPLVSFSQAKPNKVEIPTMYWSVLSDSKQTSLQHDKYSVKMSDIYMSALGFSCRELVLVDKANKAEKRTACKIPFINENNNADEAWFMEKQIIESSGYVEL